MTVIDKGFIAERVIVQLEVSIGNSVWIPGLETFTISMRHGKAIVLRRGRR
jgi:hypothetical protein